MMETQVMDPRTSLILTVAKYGGYTATLWITVSNWGLGLDGPLILLLLTLAADSIRNFFVESRASQWTHSMLWVQLLLIYSFLWLDGTGVGSILLVIMIAESQLSYSSTIGRRVFIFSLSGFLLIGTLAPWFRGQLNADRLITVMVNSVFFFFAFGVSFLARMQQQDRERAEQALLQLERSQSELETAHEKLMQSSRQRERMATIEERNRLAREIHDTVAHSLTGIIVGLEASKKLVEIDPDRSAAELARIQEQARMGLQEIRRSVKAWKPQELDAMGFESAVYGLALETAERGLHIELDMEEFRLPDGLDLPFYRIIQEGITNSLRHGQARRLDIKLRRGPSSITLMMQDDGSGVEDLVEGYGLRGMRERIERVGGTIEFANAQPHGFLIRAEVEVVGHDHSNSDCR